MEFGLHEAPCCWQSAAVGLMLHHAINLPCISTAMRRCRVSSNSKIMFLHQRFVRRGFSEQESHDYAVCEGRRDLGKITH